MINSNRNSNKQRLPLRRLYSLLALLAMTTISACSSRAANELTDITVLAQGESIIERPEMAEACKGFYVSPEKLKDFFQYAALTHEERVNNNYEKLPCYSSGTAYLGDDEIQWVLRAGGVGEFKNLHHKTQNNNQDQTQKSFTKICGVSCCDNVQGVC
ncbi:MAG: hypothetical protein HRT50_11445 [Colwellia sp.]|uniref:hypothetical protein n=1 Tax=Colwellia sp. TaxID=56799 RepID=UPI001DDA34CE|nr:hypothetical protein [Colwellia sp.]NQY49695.1 hypothetical protein [Colwellia sp.]